MCLRVRVYMSICVYMYVLLYLCISNSVQLYLYGLKRKTKINHVLIMYPRKGPPIIALFVLMTMSANLLLVKCLFVNKITLDDCFAILS